MKRNVSLPTIADLNAQEAAANQALANIAAQRKAAVEAQNSQVKATLDNLPVSLSAITGRKMTLSDALGIIRDHIKGKLNLGSEGAPSERNYRQPLSQVEKDRLKADLTTRQAVIDAGGTPSETISQISRRYKTTDATVNKYKAEWGLTRPLARKTG